MVHGGLCLGRLADGMSLFIDGGIPDEDVVVELQYRKRKAWFSKVVEVVAPSEHRVSAPCRYFGACGGCQLQHIAYPHQLDLKRDIVADALRRQQVVFPQITMHGMDDPWRYRWRGEFHVIPGNVGMADAELGFNRARSWKPIPIDDCLIHHPTITDSLAGLRDVVRAGADAGLRTLQLTVGDGGEELLIGADPSRALRRDAIEAGASLAKGRWSTGQTSLRWRDRTFRVMDKSFIQVNQGHLDTLYTLVVDAVGSRSLRRVVDAYAGIGMLSVALAEHADTVVCIENNASAVRMGILNAQLNDLSDRIQYVCESVEAALPAAVRAARAEVVVLDPPRAGCDNAVIGFLALGGPQLVVYVSCEPSTLARDLRLLTTSGPYRITSVDAVDMFAQTFHIETVVVLERD